MGRHSKRRTAPGRAAAVVAAMAAIFAVTATTAGTATADTEATARGAGSVGAAGSPATVDSLGDASGPGTESAPAAVTAGTASSEMSSPAGQTTGAADVDALLAGMSLREKVGQLFVTYVYGDTATTTAPAYTSQNQALYGVDNGAQFVAKYHPGGVIYFTWSGNLAKPAQIAGLSAGLQQAAADGPHAIPLLIGTDQEGGIVNRIGAPLAVSPGNMAIGATSVPESAHAVFRVTGEQLRALGINQDYAPVVDVNTDPRNAADGPRAFGDDPAEVAKFTRQAVLGLQHADVAATVKHFPGLGDTTINTDNGVAVTDETRDQIMSIDVPPFRAAIRAGVDSIMAAHIIAPALDPSGTPASLSRPIITGVLREELGYDGVVITDALSAAALEDVPPAQRAVEAIRAGDDQLLMPTDLPAAVDAVMQAVADGTISEQRIDQSVARILRLKEHLGLFDAATPDPSTDPVVGTPDQQATMSAVAQQSITMLRNEGHALPLAAGSGTHVLVTGWGSSSTAIVTADLDNAGLVAQRFYTGSNPSSTLIQRVVAQAAQNDVTVVTTNNAWGDTGQQRLVRALVDAGRPVVAVALGGPYDIAYFPDVPTFLATYDYQPVSLDAVARTILGADPAGRLPVTVRAVDGSGTVLYPLGSGTGYPAAG